MANYSRYWLLHLRPYNNPVIFPRQMGDPFKSFVFGKDQYIEWIKSRSGSKECYTNVYSEEQRKLGIIDTVLIDVDKIEFGLKLWRYFNFNNIYPRTMYSGKGLHLYVDFDPIKLSRPSDCIRDWASKLPMRDVGIKTKVNGRERLKPFIDPAVIGDTNRAARIPYTVNTRVKPFMSFNLPNDIGEAEDLMKRYVFREIKEPPKIEPTFGHNNVIVANALLEFDKQPVVKISSDMPRFSIAEKQLMSKKMLESYPECIKKYLETLRDAGELDHYERLQLVTFLHRVRYTEDAIVNVFRKYAHDFKESVTRYQISYVIKRDLKCRGCISAVQLGICPYLAIEPAKNNCPYYSSLNWFTQY